jgi:hypothetical protein
MAGGMGKQDYLDYQIRMAMVEGERVDLLAMGPARNILWRPAWPSPFRGTGNANTRAGNDWRMGV